MSMMRTNSYRRVQQWLTMARQWHLVDAARQDADLLGARVARHLTGKHKPIYEPMTDCGDYVVVYNCKHIAMQGFDWKRREYMFNTGYPRGKALLPAWTIHEADPCRIAFMCVYSSLDKNLWRKAHIERLFLLPDDKIPQNLLENIGVQMEQVQQVPCKLEEFTKEELEKFPRLVPKLPENVA